MKARKKLNSRAGFTLAETLLAVLILLLVSTIVATGMPVARTAYEKVVLTSNAETLLTTAVSALRNELGTAWKVESTANGVTYFSASTGARAELSIDSKTHTITLLDYAAATDLDALLEEKEEQNKATTTARDLVFQGNDERLGKLTLQATSISLSSDKTSKTVTIEGLIVKSTSGTLAEYKGNNGKLTIEVFSRGDA